MPPLAARLDRPGGARAAGPSHAGRPSIAGAGQQLRRAVAVPAESRQREARFPAVSGLRRQPAPGVPPRNGAVVRERRARGPQRARSAAGGLHVRQSSGSPSTTAFRTSTAATSAASSSGRTRARRAAGAGQHSDGDVVRQSHVAGASRQVDSREPPRHAAFRRRRRTCRRCQRTTPVRKSSPCASGWSSTGPTRRAPAAIS